MRPFTYCRARSAEEALTLVSTEDSAFIAGGTTLLDLMKLEVQTPQTLVDISRLPLGGIDRLDDGGLRIGAMVSNSDLATDPAVRQHYPLLTRALLSGATGQLRNKATTGGNLLQRTRCYYYADRTQACNRREPGSGCAAIGGYNRNHAILGTSASCIASYPGDMAVALLALSARVETRSGDGRVRQRPLDELYRQPGNEAHQWHTLDPDELISAVELPPPAARARQRWVKVRDRSSYAFALVSMALLVEIEGDAFEEDACDSPEAGHADAIASEDRQTGRIVRLQMAFGGVGTRPWRNVEVENMALKQTPDIDLFEAMADLLLQDARGQGDNDFKIPLLRRLMVSELHRATLSGDAT